jgi:hypothetical protein
MNALKFFAAMEIALPDFISVLKMKSRRAEYDRLTASPYWVRMGDNIRCWLLISRTDDAATKVAR